MALWTIKVYVDKAKLLDRNEASRMCMWHQQADFLPNKIMQNCMHFIHG